VITALFFAHVVAVGVAAWMGRGRIRHGLGVAAVVPAITSIWASSRIVRSAEPEVVELTWVAGLDIGFRFRLDSFALMMTVLVAGIGALVFVYAVGYFSADAAGGARFPSTLLAFATSMLGLVWADSVWTLFVFWELTSVTSFLLVGHKNTDPAVLLAARRALIITASGGLALLAGLIILTDASGASSLTEIGPITGTSATVAALLIMIGAATKSAQVPFHVWLPGAMAAPTPVSAYLHSATMVKAGVLLVGVAGPAFVDVVAWKISGATFGITSMLWGGIGALRHRDAKLILAWGTISQLGLLVTLLSLGQGKATFAAVSILFAHALFKATLFLVVGEIDVRTGTRDITELGGLWRSMPITFTVALLAGLSMAGAPPLLGFTAKEAAIEAVLGLDGAERLIIASAVILGSVLTVAYTARFLITVFGPGPDTPVSAPRPLMSAPSVVLGAAGLVGYVAMGAVNSIVGPAAVELNTKAQPYELIAWPGLTTAFIWSMAIVAVGGSLGSVLARRDVPKVPATTGMNIADDSIDGVLSISRMVTGWVQHGSLPVYLTTMAATATLAAIPFLTDLSTDSLVAWDHPIQGALAFAIVASAIAGAFVGSRLGAALTLGAVGVGVSALFIVQGAPDLALTQLLVETIVVVGFVIGLGHLGRQFPEIGNVWRSVRLVVSGLGGLAVMAALAAAGSNPTGAVPIDELVDGAVEVGGGKNVVNVVLTDVRALDTFGEVVVLATVAIGILALAGTGTSSSADEGES